MARADLNACSYAEATLVFPIIVAMTFAKYLKERDAKEREKKLTSK